MRFPKNQIGAGLTKEVYESFSMEEKKFWNDFFIISKKEINEMEKKNCTIPFIPSEKLKKMYKQAIERYDGGKYCHIRQLEAIFDFSIIIH